MSLGRRDYYIGPESTIGGPDGQETRILAGFKQTLGAYSLIKCITTGRTGVHTHEYDDETTYLLEGELTVVVGDTTYNLEPGGFVYMPRRVPHQFTPHGLVTVLNIQAPGGIMDGIVEDMTAAAADGKDLSGPTLQAIQDKYGIHAPDGWLLNS